MVLLRLLAACLALGGGGLLGQRLAIAVARVPIPKPLEDVVFLVWT
jgi:hypothetical protein